MGIDKTHRNTVSDVFLFEDDSPLNTYKLEGEEVHALCVCPLEELINVHSKKDYSFSVKGMKFDGSEMKIEVNKDKFPPNWDGYHFKMALLIQRYFDGDKHLLY